MTRAQIEIMKRDIAKENNKAYFTGLTTGFFLCGVVFLVWEWIKL